MKMDEATCFRNCYAKIDTLTQSRPNTVGTSAVLTLKGTKAEQLYKKNQAFLKKHDSELKNIDKDPLTKELNRFQGKFYGGVDSPII